MIIMNIFTHNNLIILLKNTKKHNNRKLFFYLSIKNFYLTIRYYKFLYLCSPAFLINFFFNNLYFLNVIENRKIDKWFILKLISVNEFIKNFN